MARLSWMESWPSYSSVGMEVQRLEKIEETLEKSALLLEGVYFDSVSSATLKVKKCCNNKSCRHV
jgi:hypothetical protein